MITEHDIKREFGVSLVDKTEKLKELYRTLELANFKINSLIKSKQALEDEIKEILNDE